MGCDGFLDPPPWQPIIVSLPFAPLTVVSVAVYWRRYSADCALSLPPAVKRVLRRVSASWASSPGVPSEPGSWRRSGTGSRRRRKRSMDD